MAGLPVSSIGSASPWGAAIQAGGQVLGEAVKGDAKSGYANDGWNGLADSGWTLNFGGTMEGSGLTTQTMPTTGKQTGDLIPGFGSMGTIAGLPVEWLLIAAVVYYLARK
jgi:hypothetical protein